MTEELNRILTGQSESHLVPWREGGPKLHRNVLAPLTDLAKAAKSAGFDLEIASGYRGFDRQLAIWNAKATGHRPLYADDGTPLEFAALTSAQILQAILRWSALPGTSRHHWGTDADVFDAAACEPGYQVQLSLEESRTRFAKLHSWLDQNLARFGFFRPYAADLGGIAPEPWHISYLSVSRAYMAAYSYSALEQLLRATELTLKDQVLENLPQIFERYFLRITTP